MKSAHLHFRFFSRTASFRPRRDVWKLIPRSRRARVFLRCLHQGSSRSVCRRRPKSCKIACLFVASLRSGMLARFPGPRMRSGYQLYCETCVLDTECETCAAGVPCRAVRGLQNAKPPPGGLIMSMFLLFSCVREFGGGVSECSCLGMSRAPEAGLATKPLSGGPPDHTQGSHASRCSAFQGSPDSLS